MPKQLARSIKPFGLFFNTAGQDEKSGTFVIQPNAAAYIQNMHVDALGQWSAYLQGTTAFTAQLESGARVDSLAWYTDSLGANYLLSSCNGKIKNVASDGTTTDISTAFTAGQPVDFETFKGTVYAASQGLAVQKWAGSGSMSAASGWPLVNGSETYDKPSICEKYANRMVFANFNGATTFPSHLVISDDLAPETFTIGTSATNAVVFQAATGDGQQIRALKTFNIPSSNTQLLLIFKDRSLYGLTGNTPATFNLFLVNNNFGCLNNRCVANVGQDLLFLDSHDIYSLTTVTNSGSIQPKPIGSEMVKKTLATLNTTFKDKAWVCHHPDRREVWFAIPTGANTECDTILVYYYNVDAQGQPINAWSVRTGATNTCGLLYDKTFYTGSSTGYINLWFTTSGYNGVGYSYIYQYPFYGFGTQYQNKRILECYVWLLVVGTETVTLKTEWRGGGNNTIQSVGRTTTITSTGGIYGTTAPPGGVYGTSVYGNGTLMKKIRVPVIGNGEQLQFTFSGTTGSTAPIFLGISGLVEYMAYSRIYK
jgi:hypothetical protein